MWSGNCAAGNLWNLHREQRIGFGAGVAGGLQAVNYNLQNLNLNSNSTLKVVGRDINRGQWIYANGTLARQ